MEHPALVECFIHGDRPRIDGAWSALSRVLPRLHAVGDGDFHVEAGAVDELEGAVHDLALLGWTVPAPGVAPGTHDDGGRPWR